MNIKGNMMSIIAVVLMFSIVMFIFLFSTIGVHQIFNENIISPVVDNVATLGVSNTTMTTVNEYKDFYSFDFINYDLFFLVFIVTVFGGTVFSAYRSTQLGMLSFFGYITIGTYIFFLALGFITSISDYMLTNFIYGLFDTATIEMPIIDFFVNNIQLISFIWFLVILLVNQFNLIGQMKESSEGGFVEE